MKLAARYRSVLVLTCIVLFNGPAFADKITIPDTVVTDQYGKQRHFYNDLVKNRIVAINFVFTRCTMVCPVAAFQFARLSALLGDRAGSDIQLISISTDALYDTPERLKAWADQFNSGTGWTQVTGDKQNIDKLLKSLKAFTTDKQDHSSLILVGNDTLNDWKWIDGASNSQVILSALSTWRTGVQ